MLVKSLARYTDLELKREIPMGQVYEVSDERAKLLIEKKLVVAAGPATAFGIPPIPPPVQDMQPKEPKKEDK